MASESSGIPPRTKVTPAQKSNAPSGASTAPGPTQSRRRLLGEERSQKGNVSKTRRARPISPFESMAPAAARPKERSQRGNPARREAATKASRPRLTKAVRATSTTTLCPLAAKRYVVARTAAVRSAARCEKRSEAVAAAAASVSAEKRTEGRRVEDRVAPWRHRIEEATDA
jgi:hypothetical protein